MRSNSKRLLISLIMPASAACFFFSEVIFFSPAMRCAALLASALVNAFCVLKRARLRSSSRLRS